MTWEGSVPRLSEVLGILTSSLHDYLQVQRSFTLAAVTPLRLSHSSYPL